MLGWTVGVGCVLWWLAYGSGGPSVWILQERDLEQPGFSQKVLGILGTALRLQRSYPWVLFGPYVAWVAWCFPLERDRILRHLPLHIAACLAFVWGCHAVGFRTSAPRPREWGEPGTPPPVVRVPGGEDAGAGGVRGMGPLPWAEPRPPSLRASLRAMIPDLLAFGAITGLVHSVYFQRRLREREHRALILETNLATARLHALKAQLQPHFLFNSLNAITALLRRDPRQAETTLVALSELLRLALSRSESQEGALHEELEFVGRYLEIQQTRFGDKLRVEQDIDPQTLDCRVPTLVLQPLVENAIRHGMEPTGRPGVVRVSARREAGMLMLTVEDDGVGLAAGHDGPVPTGSGTGIGLSNLRDRLEALYGPRQRLQVMPRPGGGVVVRIDVPWNPVASSETNDPVPG